MVSADTPTKIESTDKNSSVEATNNQIKATAGVSGSQQSTIKLGDKSLSIDVGKNGNSYDGTFTLNSKNLSVNAYGVTVKNTDGSKNIASLTNNTGLRIYDPKDATNKTFWGISSTGAISGTGLTVNGAGTSTISSTNSKSTTQYAKSEVNYSTGVKDTVANGTNTTTSTVAYNGVTDTVTNDTSKVKGYTTTAQVLYSGVNNKVVDNNTNNILAQTSVGLVDRPQDNSKYGNIVLTANKYVVDTEAAVTKKVSTTILTLDGNTAKLEAGTGGSNNAYVNLNSDKKGTVAITAGKVDGVQGNVTLSGKNVNLASTGLTVNGTSTSTINSTGTGTNDSKSAKSEVNYSTGVKDTVTNGTYTTTSTVAANSVTDTVKDVTNNTELSKLTLSTTNAELKSGSASVKADNTTGNVTLSGKNVNLGNNTFSLKNTTTGKDIAKIDSYGLNVNGTGTSSIKSTNSTTEAYVKNEITSGAMTTTARGGKWPSESDNKNKTTSQVSATGVRDTVYDDSGNIKSTSVVDTNGVTLTSNRYDTGSKISSSLTIKGDSATLASGSASVTLNNTTGNVAITANQKGSQGYVTLSGKNVNLGNNTFSLKNTTTGKDIAKIDSYGLNVNGTGTSSIKSTNSTTEAYVKNEITSGAMTTTARGGKWPSESDNKNKTTSQVSATGVRDNVYDDGGQIKATSSVTTSGIANTVNNSSITNTVNDVNTGKPLADSRLTTSGISNTTTALQMTGTNAGNTMSTGIYQNNGGISATATKKDVDGNTIGISTLSLGGNSASLKVGNYGFAVDSSNNVSITGNNATLSGNKLTLTDVTTGKTATLDTNGLSLKDANGTQIGGVSAAGAVSGTSLSIKALIDPLKPNNDYIESKVTTSGVADTIKQGGFTRATSNVAINSIKDTIYTNDGKELSSSNISKSVSDATESGSVTLIANKITTNDDATTTTLTSKLNLTGDSATLTSGSAYVKADNTTGNVLFSGKNVSLSGSTFTLKDVTNGKTLASLGDRGLSLNKVNSDGTTINYGTWNSNGLTLKDTNGKTATLTTSGLTLKDEDGNTTGGISTTGAVTGTSLNITAKNDAGNKTISKVDATSVTDTVYGTDGTTQVASSSVGINGISNNTNISGIAIKDDVNNTKRMTTSIAQDKNGVNISSTKYNVYNDGTSKVQTIDGISTISVNGAKTTISGSGNYEYKKDENGKLILDDKGNPIRSSNTSASLSVDGDTGTISLSGKNASLSGSTFTLKDTTNGKTLASLGASGLSINNADGIKVGGISNTGNLIANDGMNVTDKNSSWVTIGASTMRKDIAATTTTSYAGITNKIDTTLAGNKTYTSGTVVGPTSVTTTVQGSNTTDAISGNKNKTTSTVSATGVTDTVYNVKGNQVASSSVTTNGIVNTTTNLSIDGSTNNTMSTSISQNNRGISASATKKDENGTVGTSTLTLAGNSASLKVGNYGFAIDSNNNVSIAGNNATLSGSTFTLKDGSNNTARLTATGLTFTDASGQPIGGVSSTGVVSGTRLDIDGTSISSIKSTNATTGAMGQSQVSYSGVTDTVTNAAGNKTTSTVGATGVTDAVYGTDGARVAYSNVGTGGITNSTNISGIAIKDDKNNTKTMNTSIAQNANGVSISSTKYNVYSDGTNTIQTTDGTSSISVNGAKTTISGYGNYEYERDESGKLVVSSRNSASLSVDGESGIIGLSGKNVGLSANGLTLYKDVEGVKTQYASLTAGGLNVNGTGYTTIKSTNATTGAMGQSQVSYNGVTDTVTNAAGNKTTSTVNATGTIDQVYDTDGKTRIAYSNVTTSGITDSFTKDGVTNSVTTNANGTTFASTGTGNGSTTIKGGAITTNSITVAGNTIDDEFFGDIGHTSSKTEGIDRYGDDNVGYTTSIETTFKVHSLGTGSVDIFGSKIESTLNGQTTVINGGSITTNSLTVGNVSFGDLVNRVDVLEDKTQNITPSNPGTGEGGSVVPPTIDGQTGMEGDLTVAGEITANSGTIGGVAIQDGKVTANNGGTIGGVTMKDNTVTVGGTEGTSINKDGVTVGDKKSDNYTSITNNDVVVNNNGNKTSLADVGNRVTGLESSVNSMNNRLSDVEDRIDKVGAMSAAIANLRTMGFDPEAPTEIAIGVGQYKSETGLALGIFHYPNQDFMLSASISTSGDEVMGGIGATWKLGRKSAAEKAKDEEARRLEKAEEMKKLAQDAKVKAQAERHAKLLAEREAQKTA